MNVLDPLYLEYNPDSSKEGHVSIDDYFKVIEDLINHNALNEFFSDEFHNFSEESKQKLNAFRESFLELKECLEEARI